MSITSSPKPTMLSSVQLPSRVSHLERGAPDTRVIYRPHMPKVALKMSVAAPLASTPTSHASMLTHISIHGHRYPIGGYVNSLK